MFTSSFAFHGGLDWKFGGQGAAREQSTLMDRFNVAAAASEMGCRWAARRIVFKVTFVIQHETNVIGPVNLSRHQQQVWPSRLTRLRGWAYNGRASSDRDAINVMNDDPARCDRK